MQIKIRETVLDPNKERDEYFHDLLDSVLMKIDLKLLSIQTEFYEYSLQTNDLFLTLFGIEQFWDRYSENDRPERGTPEYEKIIAVMGKIYDVEIIDRTLVIKVGKDDRSIGNASSADHSHIEPG